MKYKKYKTLVISLSSLCLQTQVASSATRFFEAADGSTIFNVLSSDEGNVAIGIPLLTPIPTALLDVVDGYFRVRNGLLNSPPTSGAGLEIASVDGQSHVHAYDRDAGKYNRLHVNGAPLVLNSDSTGYVGVGTDIPQAILNANGTVRIDVTPTGYGEGLILNSPTDMPGGGYGGIHFHNASRLGTVGSDTIKWSLIYNYTPEGSITGNGLAFIQDNAKTRVFLATDGKVGIGTYTPQAPLDVNGEIRGTVLQLTSDRNAKAGFSTVDAREVLEKVVRLPITTWHYTNAPSERHMGTMAQDFKAAFNLGFDDKHIATVDADGVTIASIQALYGLVNEKDTRIAALQEELAGVKEEFAARFERMEKLFAGGRIPRSNSVEASGTAILP